MSTLSCLDCVTGRTRRVTFRIREAEESHSLSVQIPRAANRVQNRGRNHLYDVEVVEEEQYHVKIHYTGYESSSDEWIRKSDIRYKPVADGFGTETSDELSLALSTLASSIKQKLVPSKNLENPTIRIQLAMNSNIIQLLCERGRALGKHRGKKEYGINEYSDLDELLGEQWYIRISNTSGDFSYAIKETIRYHRTQPKSLLDFDVSKDSSGCLTFSPFFIQQPTALVFQFVRGDGNKVKLAEFL